MILVRSPLRITLGGGGTDLEPYCSEHGGFCLAAAINKYVYVAVTKPFTPGIYLKYSEFEHVESIGFVQHPIIREVLFKFEVEPQIEITTLADIPTGTGLGSSSSFTTALLMALAVYQHQHFSTKELVEMAIDIEKQVSITGRQDQYIATYGGVRQFVFDQPHTVNAPLTITSATAQSLNDRLLLFYTDETHETSEVLATQGTNTQNLDMVKQLGLETRDIIEREDWPALGWSLNSQWAYKEMRCGSADRVIQLRERALEWARGVKLIGAGRGGFLLCDTDTPTQLRHTMIAAGAPEVRYTWDYEGTKVLLS